MKVDYVDPDSVEYTDEDVIFAVKVFGRDKHGIDVGVHMQGREGASDAQLLEACQVLMEMVGKSIEQLEHNVLQHSLTADRKMRNARLQTDKQLVEAEENSEKVVTH